MSGRLVSPDHAAANQGQGGIERCKGELDAYALSRCVQSVPENLGETETALLACYTPMGNARGGLSHRSSW